MKLEKRELDRPVVLVIREALHRLRPFGLFMAKLWKKIVRDGTFTRAAGLAYSTLLALVPLSALLFSILSGFGALATVEKGVQDFLVNLLVPTRQSEILEGINLFIDNANALGIVGLVFFALTSLFLFDSISGNFNAIYGSKPRNAFATFTTYTAVLVAGSLLMAASFSLSPRVLILLDGVGLGEGSKVYGFIERTVPNIFLFLIFWFMIKTIPSTKVALWPSFAGAVLGTVAWEIIQFYFVTFAGRVIRMSVIYGSIAAIPIFLFWVYFVWMIILLSLQVTWLLQYRRYPSSGRTLMDMWPAERFALAGKVLRQIIRPFAKGDPPIELTDLARRFHTSPEELRRFLEPLEKEGILTVTESDAYLPARDPSTVPLSQVARALSGPSPAHDDPLGDFMDRGVGTLSGETLSSLAN